MDSPSLYPATPPYANNVTVLMGPYTASEIHTGEDDEQEGGRTEERGGE